MVLRGPFVLDRRLFEYVYRCLGQEYGDPEYESLPRDDETNCLIGIEKLDASEVFDEEGCPFADGSEVRLEFESRFNHLWFRLDSLAGEYGDRLLWGWDSFEQRLIDDPRSLASLTEAEMGEESAQSLFCFLQEFAANVDARFVRTCESEKELYRARAAGKILRRARQLGSPPRRRTLSQRMSAKGDSCFYAAEDLTTAESEVSASASQQVTVGTWVTRRRLRYADFAAEYEIPSLFDYPPFQDPALPAVSARVRRANKSPC